MSPRILASLSLAALLWAASAPLVPAFAADCPNRIAAVDAMLAAGTVPAEVVETVKSLRDAGSEAHNAGRHDQSMKLLDRAIKLAGQK